MACKPRITATRIIEIKIITENHNWLISPFPSLSVFVDNTVTEVAAVGKDDE